MMEPSDSYYFCYISECVIYEECPLKGTIISCTKWRLPDNIFYADNREWRNEINLKFVRPLAMTSRGLIYECVRCGRIFEYDRPIHIPHCERCREEETDELLGKSRNFISRRDWN